VTLILMGATFALLTCLGVSCRRARLDLEEQICACLQRPEAAAVGYGGHPVTLVPAPPVLTGIDGGRLSAESAAGRGRRPHLRVVEAG
jgi:hypothetical protein